MPYYPYLCKPGAGKAKKIDLKSRKGKKSGQKIKDFVRSDEAKEMLKDGRDELRDLAKDGYMDFVESEQTFASDRINAELSKAAYEKGKLLFGYGSNS